MVRIGYFYLTIHNSKAACPRKQYITPEFQNQAPETLSIKGTSFKAKSHKKGNENLEHWLLTRLNQRIDFSIYEFDYKAYNISMFIIPATINQPVEFLHQAYIRVGSITRKLNEFPQKQAKIWKKDNKFFESQIVKEGLSASDISKLLSAETYFDLLQLPYPSTQKGVIDKLIDDGIVVKCSNFGITMVGALLFAKDLTVFERISRKTVRIIVFKGNNKVTTLREKLFDKGYAVSFVALMDWLNSQLPENEEISKALREISRMYPEIALRELVANAIIHQDFNENGSPIIEIYPDRVEISNSGLPLVAPERFIDAYISRNEKLADLMRRMGFCEEKGSGLDKVIHYNELYQLPPIQVVISGNRTCVSIFAHKPLSGLDKKEKIRACYQHACLKYVSNEKMTNQSLRDRFNIADHNYSIASRIIRDSLDEGVIKEDNPDSKSRKYASYIPFWA